MSTSIQKQAIAAFCLTSTILASACNSTSPFSETTTPNKTPDSLVAGAAPLKPAPSAPPSESCLDQVQPLDQPEITDLSWLEDFSGEYRLESVQLSEALTTENGRIEFTLESNAASKLTSFHCENSEFHTATSFESTDQFPSTIRTNSGDFGGNIYKIVSEFQTEGAAPFSHATATLSPAPSHFSFRQLQQAILQNGGKLKIYRVSPESIALYAQGEKSRSLSIYRLVEDSTPIIPNNRCGISHGSIQIDGSDAFNFLDEVERLKEYKLLLASGVCSSPNRLSVKAGYIQIDSMNSFYFLDEETRLEYLLQLQQAGAGGDKFNRCGAARGYVTIDGKSSAYFLDEAERLNALLDLMQTPGACTR